MTPEEKAKWERIDEETRQQHLVDFPLKEGYVRIYTDHTGRWFEDRLPYVRGSDPLYDFISDEIQKEINQEVVREIKVLALTNRTV